MALHDNPAPGHGWTYREFEELYAATHRDVFFFLTSRVGRQTAEDLTAQAFAEAWRVRDRFDPARGAPRAWLFGISANLVRRHRRSEMTMLRAIARLPVLDVMSTDEAAVVGRIDADRQSALVAEVFAGLDDLDRDIISLVAHSDMSMSQIAAALGVPIGTIKSRLSRARHRVQMELASGAASGAGA